MTSRSRSRAVLVLVLAAVLASLLLVPSPPAQAAGAVIAGEKVSIAGTLSPRVKRPVSLEIRSGSRWKKVMSSRTSSTGRYTFAVRAPKVSSSYRVVAPRARIGRTTYAARTSSARKVTVAAQTARITAPATTVQGAPLTVEARFSPARKGRQVRLQTLVESYWEDVATGTQDSAGRASLTVTPNEVGTRYLRVVTSAAGGAASVTSVHHKVTVDAPPPPPNPYVEWVSRTIGDTRLDNYAATPDVSADGRYVVFASDATNLVAMETGKLRHIYLRDRQTGTTLPVDVTAFGQFGNGRAADPAISADGRFVTYTSASTDLAAGDGNEATDVFMWDRESGSTRLISQAANGAAANGPSAGSTLGNISADGRYVAYQSRATDLPGSSTDNWKIYRYDRTTFSSTMVSVAIGRQQPDGDSTNATISDDGSVVAFQSNATSLVAPSNPNGRTHVYRATMDQQSPGLGLVSRTAGGYPSESSTAPRLSGNGLVVSFSSRAALTPGDTNQEEDAYVADLADPSTRLISSAPNGDPGNGRAYASAVSYDGRFVYFGSSSTNIGPGNQNGYDQAYRWDRDDLSTRVVSVNHDGSTSRGGTIVYATTSDGSAAVASSYSFTMVPQSYAGYDNIYLLKAERP